jgi:hypothetical protein
VCGGRGGVGVVGVWGHSLHSTFHRLHLLRLWTPTILKLLKYMSVIKIDISKKKIDRVPQLWVQKAPFGGYLQFLELQFR